MSTSKFTQDSSKREDEQEPKELYNVKDQLRKAFGRNYKLLNEIAKNTKALENISEQLKQINETLKNNK